MVLNVMEEDLIERKLYSSFEKYEEFVNDQQLLLRSYQSPSSSKAQDDVEEYPIFKKLKDILDEYQEQSYLLDPFLEELVVPIVELLKAHAKDFVSGVDRRASSGKTGSLALLLYHYIKCRGYKTIIRFFPHEVADLWIVVGYMNAPNSPVHEQSQWALRYVVLLWLSLICMIPFDLSQFDEGEPGHTAMAIESISKKYLGNAGLEREGAALVLSRFYVRQDMLQQFADFIEWANALLSGPIDLFTTIGTLQVLCEVLKSGPLELVQSKVPELIRTSSIVDSKESLVTNPLVRKYKTKMSSRIGLRLLPGRSGIRRAKARALTASDVPELARASDDDFDVPEVVEVVLESLFTALQDKDTLVRWSAAKGIARIAERLPSDFSDQVFETVLGHFSIHSLVATALYDIPAIAESTWHGACLACAEMARRGIVSPDRLRELIGWLSMALYFDVRKGAHSVGSNVRDAGAYVLWALARSLDPSHLSPYANDLARNLVTVSLFDREIHIRRAASAAFQEFVGRTNLFPHGIDVLRKTDFYAVGIRRNSFLVAAPQVAEHIEYRPFLFDHLLNVTLRHWDLSMRRTGAQSLRLICLSDMAKFGEEAIKRSVKLLEATDVSDIHGGLLALTEVAIAYQQIETDGALEHRKRGIFGHLARVPESTLLGPRNELVTIAACELVAHTITLEEVTLGDKSTVPNWRKFIDYGLKHRTISVQEAAVSAMGAISQLVDCSAELKKGPLVSQQSLGRVLGVIDYNAFPTALPQSIEALLEGVNRSAGPYKSNVEARRSCYEAMPQILVNTMPRLTQLLSPETVISLLDALLNGLGDYTIDERGDVGSWIRISCICGLTSFAENLFPHANRIPDFEKFFPPSKYADLLRGILKQGVERLDNVRQVSGESILKLLRLPLPDAPEPSRWAIHDAQFMSGLFSDRYAASLLVRIILQKQVPSSEDGAWSDATWLFPKAVQLLEIEPYRNAILLGLIASVGSLTDSTHRPVTASLVLYVQSLPLRSSRPGKYDLLSIVNDLIVHAQANATSNAVFIPVLQVFNVLLEGEALRLLSEDEEGVKMLRLLLTMVTKHVDRLKSVKRIHESMKVLVNMLSFKQLFQTCVASLSKFLGHRFPTIRSDTAEYLYLALQSLDLGIDTDDVEEVLLDAEWPSSDFEAVSESAKQVTKLLLEEDRKEE